MNAVLQSAATAPPAWPDRLDPDAPPAALPRMTREEYLAFDNAAVRTRYEWVDGKVRLMTGGTFNHALVGMNLVAILNAALRPLRHQGGPSLAALGQTMRTRIPDGPYYYPDAVAGPIPPVLEDDGQNTLLDPVLIAEVLSPSTARIDRGEKRREYLRIPTLENYLIVQPNLREVLRLTRDASSPENPRWAEKRFRDEDVDLPRFGVTLPMAALYEDCTLGERIA
ncbi:Uma2 family endonuclease [Alienimonas californiensis]|uniref:Putative restriction endonuclease domain-containing protein n=1 Tax=Alienimonas californiensis TaxID=2527989 RepID=A0A517P9F4_9PLAN|nr:Uma2 family endonuclease [Alienimonas californiensis]QDT16001.1 hypothetical protein CA12_20990 [Alienimonas californiensis]